VDIRVSEREKRILYLGIKLFRKKIGKKATVENISLYLRSSKDKGFHELLDMLDFIVDNTKGTWQKMIMKEYTEFAIFLAVNHPTYRIAMENLIKKFTKYDNIKIDLEPCLGYTDRLITDHIIKYIFKKFSERLTYQYILSDSYSTINNVAKYVMVNLDDALKDVKDEYQYKTIRTFTWLGVWIAICDTAYRHQFYYILNKIGNKELHELSKEFYFEPSNWYINVYEDGYLDTRRLWEKNEIPHHENSLIEEPCVVYRQQQTIKKYAPIKEL
jgi:hypothetical protein